jgi:hypothetical protein
VPVEEFEKWLARQASLEQRIDTEPYDFHSAVSRNRVLSGNRGSKKNERAASKPQPKPSVGFRPVSIQDVTEPGQGIREPSEKEG